MARHRTYPAHYHAPRVYAGRHDDSVHTFANGYVYGPAERRAGIRACIRVMRTERAEVAAEMAADREAQA